MPGAQQIEAGHRFAHQSDRAPPLPAPACREDVLAQRFFAEDDCLEPSLERSVRSKHLPHGENYRQRSEPGEYDDRVIEPNARRQPVGDLKIL
jgi:hypothetical protein